MKNLMTLIMIILLTSCSVFFKTAKNKTPVQETIPTSILTQIDDVVPIKRIHVNAFDENDLYAKRNQVIAENRKFAQVSNPQETEELPPAIQNDAEPTHQTIILRVRDNDGSVLYESELPINK